MSRTMLGALVAAGAVWLGVVAIGRRQYMVGIIALAIAVLRSITVYYAVRGGASKKQSDGVRLNIEPPQTSQDPEEDPGKRQQSQR